MLYYVPATFEENDYRPSWTGNSCYSTVTIRGIFDTYEKAEDAAKNWDCDNYCTINTFDIEEEDDEEEATFDFDYDGGHLCIWKENCGYYKLNEIVDEDYSAVYDEYGQLGVTDY